MPKSLLEVYLQKMSAGDTSVVERLCAQLVEKMVEVPLSGELSEMKLPVRIEIGDEFNFVPVFTSKEFFLRWKNEVAPAADSVSLFAGDLCAALGDAMGVSINPLSGHAVVLYPAEVLRIAELSAAVEPEADPFTDEINEPAAPFDPLMIEPAAFDKTIPTDTIEVPFDSKLPNGAVNSPMPASVAAVPESKEAFDPNHKTVVGDSVSATQSVEYVEKTVQMDPLPAKRKSLLGALFGGKR